MTNEHLQSRERKVGKITLGGELFPMRAPTEEMKADPDDPMARKYRRVLGIGGTRDLLVGFLLCSLGVLFQPARALIAPGALKLYQAVAELEGMESLKPRREVKPPASVES